MVVIGLWSILTAWNVLSSKLMYVCSQSFVEWTKYFILEFMLFYTVVISFVEITDQENRQNYLDWTFATFAEHDCRLFVDYCWVREPRITEWKLPIVEPHFAVSRKWYWYAHFIFHHFLIPISATCSWFVTDIYLLITLLLSVGNGECCHRVMTVIWTYLWL